MSKLARRFVPFALALLATLGCGGGSAPGLQAPANLSYPQVVIQTIVDLPLAVVAPTVTGPVDHFAIGPLLPAGLTFDARTGAIGGTPTTPSPEATYTVTAVNGAGMASTRIDLFVAGRVPDLRFQWTGAFPASHLEQAQYSMATPPDGAQGITMTWTGLARWAPLAISSPTGDGWSSIGIGVDFPLVGGTTSTYTTDHLAVLGTRLDDFAARGLVVASLDLSVRGFGVVAHGPQDGTLGYATTRTTLASLADLSAWAAARGQANAVVTAIARFGKPYDNAPATGPILALAATRQGDARTFETQVVSGTPLELSQLLPPLGQQGYTVTAFGAGDQTAYVAVLTRPAGTATPHVIEVHGAGLPAGSGYAEGFVPVGRMTGLGGTSPYDVFQR